MPPFPPREHLTSSLLAFGREVAIIVIAASIILAGMRYLGLNKLPQVADVGGKTLHADAASPMVGDQVTVSGLSFTPYARTVLLLTNKSCKYCAASTEFHRRLLTTAAMKHESTAVLVPDLPSHKSYAGDLGIEPGLLHAWSDLNFTVAATPTVLLLTAMEPLRQCGSAG